MEKSVDVLSTTTSNLDKLLQYVAKGFSEQEIKDAVNWTKNVLQGEYTNLEEDNLSKCFDMLRQHGRVSETDTSAIEFYVEKFCKEKATKGSISKEMEAFKGKIRLSQQDRASTAQFIGRDEDVCKILDELQTRPQADSSGENVRAINLHGEGGVGKTRLAEEIAKRLCANADCKSIVVNLRDITRMDNVYFEVIRKFVQQAFPYNAGRIYESIKNLKHELILVFDNAEDVLINIQDFKDFLGNMIRHDKQRRLQIVITSRLMLDGVAQVSNYLVKPFSQEQSQEILLQRTGFNLNVALMSEIAKLCRNKPLLLKGIAGILREKLAVGKEILEKIEINIAEASNKKSKETSAGANVEQQAETQVQDKQRANELEDRAVLQEMFSKLSEPLKNYLIKLSLFRREFRLLDAQQMLGPSTKEVSYYLNILISKEFLESRTNECGEKMFHFHPMMQSFLKRLRNTPQYQVVTQEAKVLFWNIYIEELKRLAHRFPKDYIQVYIDFEMDYPNFEQLLEFTLEEELSTFSKIRGELYELPCLLEKLLTVKQREDVFRHLAKQAVTEGSWLFAANSKCWEALQQINQIQGGNKAKEVLAKTESYLLNEPEKDSKQYQEVKNMLLYAQVKTCYSYLEEHKKDLYKALDNLQQSLNRTERIFGKDTATARCLKELGNIHNKLGELEMALTYYERAYKMQKELSGSNDYYDMAVDLNVIATVHEKTGVKLLKEKKTEEGKEELTKAIALYQRALDLEFKPKYIALIKRNMANAYLYLEEPEKAWKLALEAYEIRRRDCGKHPDTVKSLFQLSNVKYWSGDYQACLTYLHMADEMEESLAEGQHSTVKNLIKKRVREIEVLEQKMFSETFKVGVEGRRLSFCDCVVDIPPGALSAETSICLSIEQVKPPDGICVTPILHCEPDDLQFNREIVVTLPLNGRPYNPVDKANVPAELKLMVRGSNEERWRCDGVQKFSSSEMSCSCRHFSIFVWMWFPVDYLKGKFWCKNFSCSLFEMSDDIKTTHKIVVCETSLEDRVSKKVKECGFCIKDTAMNVPVVWGKGLAIHAEADTSVKVEPCKQEIDPQFFKMSCEASKCFTSIWVDFSVTEAKVAFTVDNCEPQTSYPKLNTSLHLKYPLSESNPSLQSETTVQPFDEQAGLEQKESKVCANGNSMKAPNTGIEDKPSSSGDPKISVLLLCDEWGSSKGGLSTFNRQLAVHLAREKNTLSVHCYLPEVSNHDRESANQNNITLIGAKPVTGNSDPFLKLHQLPPELPRPDIVISHGRKFGTAAYFIQLQYKSCKRVHFVHVDCEEMAKHKDNPHAMSENNRKDLVEVAFCKEADLAVAVGPRLAEKYNSDLIKTGKKVEVFIPGVSEEFLSLPQSSEDKEKFHVYIFGRGSKEDFRSKGFDIAANAVASLGEGYNLYFVGAPAGKEDEVKKYFCRKTNIKPEQLNVVGYCVDRDRLKDLMCRADVIVMPSRAEAFGLIGLEALSAGIPVLVSAFSGLGSVMKDLVHGDTNVVESKEPKDWAKKIESLRNKKRSLRNAEARELRTKYSETYSWDKECVKLAKLFCSLTGKDYVASENQS